MPRGTKQNRVSIIIPHIGKQEILQECLDSLNKTHYPELEIIVVNNDARYDSLKTIKNKFPNVKLIQSEYNRGFAGGCNLGAQHANGNYLLILNNDTIHENDWIQHMVQRIESDKNISAVQPKVKNYKRRDYFDYAGGSGGLMDKYCFPYARGRVFNTIEKDNGQYDNACRIFWASGTAFLTRKHIFHQLGGFDETFFAHMEEIDYHWKCQMLGYKIWVEPKSVVYHHGGSALPAASPNKTFLNYRNSLVLLLTNYPLNTSFKLFFPRIIMEFISLIKELLLFRWDHAFSIVRSWIWIIFHLSFLYKRRQKLEMNEEIDNIYEKSIVIKYYLMGKKTFSQIN